MSTSTYTKGDVILLKLKGGEEYVGQFITEDSETVTMKNVVGLAPINGGKQGMMIQLMPIIFANPQQEVVEMYKNGLMMKPIVPPEQMIKHYREQMSGIQIVTGEQATSIIELGK